MTKRIAAAALVALASGAMQPALAKPPLAVLTDIGNEPDDQMSLVRLLLYSNEIDIAAIVAVTSVWQRDKLAPGIAEEVIDAYGQVAPNLALYARGLPSAALLKSRVFRGVPRYGLAGIHPDHPSPGARALLALAREEVGEPRWIAAWGGTNTLAEALEHARRTLSADALARIVARLRVYSTTATCRPNWLALGDCPSQGVAHVILAVTDSGKPALTRYRRIIVTVTQPGRSQP